MLNVTLAAQNMVGAHKEIYRFLRILELAGVLSNNERKFMQME
jgi:hypothetical protein